MNAKEIKTRLEMCFNPLKYIFLTEVPMDNHYTSKRRIDAISFDYWDGSGYGRIGYEIKVSRPDFLHELDFPEKSLPFRMQCNAFYFVVPTGLVHPEEIPEWAGLLEVSETFQQPANAVGVFCDGTVDSNTLRIPQWRFGGIRVTKKAPFYRSMPVREDFLLAIISKCGKMIRKLQLETARLKATCNQLQYELKNGRPPRKKITIKVPYLGEE